jgi:hypothetical protein
VRMEMGMTSTTTQEFPREHSSSSQSPRPSLRMIIEVYPLTMILWRLNLRMISIPVGKLPQFDGTNFAKWKHMMKAYLTGLNLELWNIVCGF